MKKIFLLLLSTLISFNAFAKTQLTFDTYNPQKNSIFSVSSTLILGDKEVILVDAQFQKNDAQALVDKIKASGKKLKVIYVSHSDPDFYFGLDVLHKNFPNAKILSTAQTAFLINASKDGKLAFWKPQLKENAPSHIIVPQAIKQNHLDLEGHRIEIKSEPETPDDSYLWIPSQKVILGGIPVSLGIHVWFADNQSEQDLKNWVKILDGMQKLNPKLVIPSHAIYEGVADYTPKSIEQTKNYLQKVIQYNQETQNSAQFIQHMKADFPNLAEESSLEMSAKVLKQEMPWEKLKSYPALNKSIIINFDQNKKEILNIIDHLTLKINHQNTSIPYEINIIAPKIYLLSWTDQNKNNIVQIQNFNTNTVYSKIIDKNGKIQQHQGEFTFR